MFKLQLCHILLYENLLQTCMVIGTVLSCSLMRRNYWHLDNQKSGPSSQQNGWSPQYPLHFPSLKHQPLIDSKPTQCRSHTVLFPLHELFLPVLQDPLSFWRNSLNICAHTWPWAAALGLLASWYQPNRYLRDVSTRSVGHCTANKYMVSIYTALLPSYR